MNEEAEPLLFKYQTAKWKTLGRVGISPQNRRNHAHRIAGNDWNAADLFAQALSTGRMICANAGCERFLDFGENALYIYQEKPSRHTVTLAYCSASCQRCDHFQSAAHGLHVARSKSATRKKSQ
jgi:hypothetical protein